MKSILISDSLDNSQAELICVFEYMRPGIIWGEHNVIFICRMKDAVYAYHYIHDVHEDSKELDVIYDFFLKKGIGLSETPVNVIPTPFFSRVLFPPNDCGKPFYEVKRSGDIVDKIKRFLFFFSDELMMNKELSFIDKIKKIHLRKENFPAIYLYHPMENSGCEWQLVPNW